MAVTSLSVPSSCKAPPSHHKFRIQTASERFQSSSWWRFRAVCSGSSFLAIWSHPAKNRAQTLLSHQKKTESPWLWARFRYDLQMYFEGNIRNNYVYMKIAKQKNGLEKMLLVCQLPLVYRHSIGLKWNILLHRINMLYVFAKWVLFNHESYILYHFKVN